MPEGDEGLTDAESALRAALPKARKIAAAGGRKHPLWDVIFDAVALLDGAPTSVRYASREEGMERLYDQLKAIG